jgi:hypothetical protein
MSLPWLAIPLALATALSTTLGGDLIALSGGVVVAIALLDVLPEAERELGRPGVSASSPWWSGWPGWAACSPAVRTASAGARAGGRGP